MKPFCFFESIFYFYNFCSCKQAIQRLKLILILILVSSCNSLKYLKDKEILLYKQEITVDNKKVSTEKLNPYLKQKENSKVLGIPLKLQLYNLANLTPKENYYQNLYNKPNTTKFWTKILSEKQVHQFGKSYIQFNQWLTKTGEKPVSLQEHKTIETLKNLKKYYWNQGFFNVKGKYCIDTIENQPRKAKIHYELKLNKPFIINQIDAEISAKYLNKLYQKHLKESLVRKNEIFTTENLEKERDRLFNLFKNKGVYNFEKESIYYQIDSLHQNNTVSIILKIKDRPNISLKKDSISDNYTDRNHSVYKASTVKNIFITTTQQSSNTINKFQLLDSTKINGYTFLWRKNEKFKYKHDLLIDHIMIKPNQLFSDKERSKTYQSIANLKTFKYPNIHYKILNDSLLNAHIELLAKKKYQFNIDLDTSTSSIQLFGLGLGGNFTIRNLFKGAEYLEIYARGSIGASKEKNISVAEQFFDISEFKGNLKLIIPRIIAPFDTKKIIPSHLSPTTQFLLGSNFQKNIGLDRQSLSGIYKYQWQNKNRHQLELINIQYVRNLNVNNYFNNYNTQYNLLNEIAQRHPQYNIQQRDENGNLSIPLGADLFLNNARSNRITELSNEDKNSISAIYQRKRRLTQDNLIIGSSYTFTHSSSENPNNQSQNYHNSRVKIELTGNLLYLLSKNTNWISQNNEQKYTLFNVNYSQFTKLEAQQL